MIRLPQGFDITSSNPIDKRLVLSQQEMAAIIDAKMPDVYFAICKDNGKFYVYNKTNEKLEETGRFRVLDTDDRINAYDGIRRIKEYLYEVYYSNLDYKYANDYFNAKKEIIVGKCSSFRKGNWYGRHLD